MLKYNPKLGSQYGYLSYIGEAERIVRPSKTVRAGYFVCICAGEVVRPIQDVMQGSITSCGCMKSRNREDLTGETFNRLTVVEKVGVGSNGTIWKCVCECGTMKQHSTGNLKSLSVISCGCSKGTHKMTNTPTYRSYRKMLDRTKYTEYEEWHGDVDVHDRWNPLKGGSFENFLDDMGERPEGKTLNRIQGAKIYGPETCEWADLSLQSFDQKKSIKNTSGRTGVFQVKKTGRWVATIKKNGKVTQVYRGDSFEEACAARSAAEIEYYGFSKE